MQHGGSSRNSRKREYKITPRSVGQILLTLLQNVHDLALVGVGYALLAQQQWSTKAVIAEPKPEDLLPMQKISTQASALGLTGFPDGKNLYQEFVQEFNAYENPGRDRTLLMKFEQADRL
ncbi:hypothetical protein C0708_22335 [Aeromonas caviae]|uniref:Uncharacterized protein n=1 Tax=Aeromonas caviae TaxID=648 RepID=A0A7D5YP30_AERCA|nr:hypothetical protein [Aeromonas caviae]QLI59031.1 hypothetical protein C0708_22335 [Aeromonas caviae]QLI60210.1 hypothetical protein C1C91_22100 [Aeromonas caviae]